jgi:hypothetical protein
MEVERSGRKKDLSTSILNYTPKLIWRDFMADVKVICDNPKCKKEFWRNKSEHNRSKRLNRNQYCSRSCYGKSEDNVGFKNVNEEIALKHQRDIKKHCGNRRDKYTSFRYFIKVSKNSGRNPNINVDLDYLLNLWKKQEGVCPITGWELSLPNSTSGWEDNRFRYKRASLDRIDDAKGYIKGNVRFISWTANVALNAITDEELVDFCKAVAKNNK